MESFLCMKKNPHQTLSSVVVNEMNVFIAALSAHGFDIAWSWGADFLSPFLPPLLWGHTKDIFRKNFYVHFFLEKKIPIPQYELFFVKSHEDICCTTKKTPHTNWLCFPYKIWKEKCRKESWRFHTGEAWFFFPFTHPPSHPPCVEAVNIQGREIFRTCSKELCSPPHPPKKWVMGIQLINSEKASAAPAQTKKRERGRGRERQKYSEKAEKKSLGHKLCFFLPLPLYPAGKKGGLPFSPPLLEPDGTFDIWHISFCQNIRFE